MADASHTTTALTLWQRQRRRRRRRRDKEPAAVGARHNADARRRLRLGRERRERLGDPPRRVDLPDRVVANASWQDLARAAVVAKHGDGAPRVDEQEGVVARQRGGGLLGEVGQAVQVRQSGAAVDARKERVDERGGAGGRGEQPRAAQRAAVLEERRAAEQHGGLAAAAGGDERARAAAQEVRGGGVGRQRGRALLRRWRGCK